MTTTRTCSLPKLPYVLEFYEPGKHPNTLRKARRPVESTAAAREFLNNNRDTAFLPASVVTRGWRPEVVTIFA